MSDDKINVTFSPKKSYRITTSSAVGKDIQVLVTVKMDGVTEADIEAMMLDKVSRDVHQQMRKMKENNQPMFNKVKQEKTWSVGIDVLRGRARGPQAQLTPEIAMAMIRDKVASGEMTKDEVFALFNEAATEAAE